MTRKNLRRKWHPLARWTIILGLAGGAANLDVLHHGWAPLTICLIGMIASAVGLVDTIADYNVARVAGDPYHLIAVGHVRNMTIHFVLLSMIAILQGVDGTMHIGREGMPHVLFTAFVLTLAACADWYQRRQLRAMIPLTDRRHYG